MYNKSIKKLFRKGCVCMKPYTLILVKSDLSKQKFFFSELSSDKKRNWLKQEINEHNGHLYCNCLYPDSKLELHITADNKISPMGHHYVHADSCPKSALSKQFTKYNSAFQRMEDDENKIFANVSLDFSRKKQIQNYTEEHLTCKVPTIINGKMTVSALIKKLNMATFQDMAFSKQAVVYLPIEDFCRWVKWKTKYIYVAKQKTLQSLSLNEDNKKFFYGIYNGTTSTSTSYMQIILKEFYSKKNKETNTFENDSYELKLSYKKE